MLRPLTLICCLLAAPVLAETSVLNMAQDRYEAGQTVQFDGPPGQDLFMAGNRVTVAAPVGASAHLAGRQVMVDAAVAGDLFAAGYSVTVTAPVGGDASVTGYEVTLAPVTGNLRAAGSGVTVASVGGYALITAEDITLQGAIAGDAVTALAQNGTATAFYHRGARAWIMPLNAFRKLLPRMTAATPSACVNGWQPYFDRTP